MDTFLGRFKNLIVLAAILFAQVIGLAVQVRRPTDEGETRLIRVWAISAVTPIETAVVHSQQWVQDIFKNYAYLRGVRRENRELRAQLDQMKIQQTRMEEDATMARRIQALLGFKEQYVDTTVAAQVIGTSGSDQSRVLYIDKGSNDGIKTDMAVITPNGIVGKIVQSSDNWSQVLPINDQFSGVGAALKDSRLQGILKGTPNGATTLQYIMSDETVKPGEDVITSGGDRIFPKGLPIGKVASVTPGKDLFLNIRVTPSAQLNQVEDVLVVTKITEKMPDTTDLGPLRASDILAERLPTVPTKVDVDAAGNAKPNSGTAAAGTMPARATPASGTRPVVTANRPATVANGVNSKSAGTFAAAGARKPKPTASAANHATATADAPNGLTTAKPKITVVDNDAPAAKHTKPPTESIPAEQPATPPAGAPPQ